MGPGVSMENYTSEMEARWQRAETGRIQPAAKAMMMLNRAGCTDHKRTIILSQCEGLEKQEFYAKLKKQLKVAGGGGPSRGSVKGKGDGVKLELEGKDDDIIMTSDGSVWERKR